ncbi:hypothetical protein GCM10023166_21840 [Paeniglutamicibacter cryotolerans]
MCHHSAMAAPALGTASRTRTSLVAFDQMCRDCPANGPCADDDYREPWFMAFKLPGHEGVSAGGGKQFGHQSFNA